MWQSFTLAQGVFNEGKYQYVKGGFHSGGKFKVLQFATKIKTPELAIHNTSNNNNNTNI